MPVARAEAQAGPGVILDAAACSLEGCAAFLAGLGADKYSRACPRMFDSTIGQHVRHSIDHFAAVVASLDGAVVDYDHRERQTPIERDRAHAIAAIEELLRRFSSLTSDTLGASVRVRIMVSAEGEEAELRSTFGRELAFATHHATHHFAMIASIAAEFGVEIPSGFGKAPSTIHNERRVRSETGR